MLIQPITTLLWPQAALIHQQCYDKGWSLESLKKTMKTPGMIMWGAVADDNKSLFSFCIFQQLYEIIEIIMICTSPQRQRQNLAMQILHNIFAFYAQESIDKVVLEVQESNYKAVALYNKLGFKNFSIRRNYYGINKNAIVMQKVFVNKKNKIY